MSKVFTKAQLIAGIATHSGETKKLVTTLLESLETVVKAAVAGGEVVSIPGVVRLALKKREARMGRNPATGEPLSIPAKEVVAAKSLLGR
ncbi:HU family DNA-binding protein [Cypionkella sp.]|uniref:HU family DNA-binding protein n=1 Tax=Cypionkella sp. TaxID=2811411 RepID=UPI0027263355|nr:HU family DNA-binding protein [Cypionkella sp.]MDO8986081.1 HU family DNA-binding protein [Cypionkella sp.]